MKKANFLFLIALWLLAPATLAQRITQSITTGWLFAKAEKQNFADAVTPTTGWEKVALPHTWNATDVLDDEPGYYRGVGWYKKTLHVPAEWQNRRLYLYFEGANQEAEFNSETRQEATPHINNKSLLTGDRQPKDAYLFYQAHLLKTPFLRIGSRTWTLRAGPAAHPDSLFCRQPVEVYTNQPAVQLFLNGKSLGTQPVLFGVARFEVPFGNGINQLRAQAAGLALEDATDIEFELLPVSLRSAQLPFTELNVSLGDERTFTDAKLHQVWVPEQAYAPGGWGYVGGRVYQQAGDRLPYGSDRNILGTDYDALYETQRLGLSQFRLDVPDGEYEVALHFAELELAEPGEQLVYNLANGSGTAGAATTQNRAFSVLVNGQELPELNTATSLLPLQAVRYAVPVSVRGQHGIVIDFKARTGDAFLNGIQVKRLY